MAIKIYPYKQGSRSARLLADTLGARVLRLEGSRYRPRQGDMVINWGNSVSPWNDDDPITLLNYHQYVRLASNKLTAFQRWDSNTEHDISLSIPDFWTNQEDIPDEAFPVVCRTVLSGHSGAGIFLADTRNELVRAPLYTKYIKKLEEFRVHVVRDKVIFTQRKAKRYDVENPDYRIRNLANGFNFVLSDIDDARLSDLAVSAVKSLGLDFGAVDIIYNQRQDRYYVLEVNCAPGLEQRTADMYALVFREL